jgi:hypothetical protein
VRTLLIASITTACLAFAPAALADTVGTSLSSSSPEQGIPVTVTLSGSAGAMDSDGDGPFLYAEARPAGGAGCQSSFGADQAAAGDASQVLVDGDEQNPGAFSEQTSFVPDSGAQIICAWLETDGDDGDDIATPDEVTAGPITTSLNASLPQVGPISVSVPASIKIDQAYNITYSTQTDQDLSLDSIVIPASKAGCAGSYELELADVAAPDDIFGGNMDTFGTATNQGIDTEFDAGTYTICTWIEGPDDQEVDGMNATNIKVGIPVTGATASSSGSSGATTSSGSAAGAVTTSGSSTATPLPACIVPKFTGTTLAGIKKRLIAAHCAVGTVRYAKIHPAKTAGAKAHHRTKAGRVLKLGNRVGTKLRHGAAVSIIVARA